MIRSVIVWHFRLFCWTSWAVVGRTASLMKLAVASRQPFWWGTWRRILPLPQAQAIKTEMPAHRPVPSSIFAVDQPFRQWLRSIDPEEDDMTETTARWQGIARGIAEQLGQQMVLEAGSAALVGHRVKLDAGKKTERMELDTAPKAYNRFRAGLYKLYPKTNDEGGTA